MNPAAAENGAVRWNDREVVELLNIWGDKNVQNHLKRTFRNYNIFEDIAEALREKGIRKTAEQCRLKIKKFKSKYRSLKEQYENSPKSFARKAWQYYPLMDTIMSDQASTSDSTNNILRASLQNRGGQRVQEQPDNGHFLTVLLNTPKDTPGTSEASWPAINSAQVMQRLKTGDTLNAPQSMTQREMKPLLPKPSTSAMSPPYLENQLSPQPQQQQQQRPQTAKAARPQQQRPAKASPSQQQARSDADDSEPQQVCLRWNSFHSNMETMFPTLLYKEKFVDVTLACEGRIIKCHKVVLSSCSPYLERLLSDNPCKHPIILMPKDVPYWSLRAIVDFMYRGEVNVEHEQLAPLLAAAESLQIKGLAGDTGNQPEKNSQKDRRPAVKRKRNDSPNQSQQPQQKQATPVQPQQSTSSQAEPSQPVKKEKGSPPPTKRPQMAPHIAESLRGLSPGIEITPLVTFEEIKSEPVDADDSNDEGSLEPPEDFGIGKGYDDGDESLPVSHVESLIEEEDVGDLNDHSHPPDPSDLLSTEMDPIDDDCDDSVNVYSENGMDFTECGLTGEPGDLVEYPEVCMPDDPGEDPVS